MSQEISSATAGDVIEPLRATPGRGLSRHGNHPMDDFGSGRPVGRPEMQEFSFFDFLDIINPLQHIPVVSSLYRAVTGDELKPFARVIGGALFGGPSGLMRGVAEAILEQGTGKDIGQHLAGMVGVGDDAGPPVATLRLEPAAAAPVADGNAPAVVALGLETLADGPSEWAMARAAADAAPAPAADPGIAGGVADARLLGDSEPLPAIPEVVAPRSGAAPPPAPNADPASATRLKAFVASKPGAPIDTATLMWLIEATPIVSAAAAAFGRPEPGTAAPPAGGPDFVTPAPPAPADTDPDGAAAAAMAVTAPSITAPSIDGAAPAPPSLERPLEEQQSNLSPEPQRAPVVAFGREEFYEGTFRTGPRRWAAPVMVAEPVPVPTPTRAAAGASVAASASDLPPIPTVPPRPPTPAGVPTPPRRQFAAAGLIDLPPVAPASDPGIPAVVANSGEPVYARPSRTAADTAVTTRRAVVATVPQPARTAASHRAAPDPAPAAPRPVAPRPVAAAPRLATAPVPRAPAHPAAASLPPVADGPRVEDDETAIAAASAAWLNAMPAASPVPAALAELEPPALRRTMTATPATPAAPPVPEAAAAEPGPTAMLSTELLAQVMMSNLDKYQDLARQRAAGRVVKAGLN